MDDSASVRLAYQQLLKREGFTVDTASSIAEGYERARHGGFDVVIVDYFLGDGSGDTLCRKLRAEPAMADTLLAVITASYKEDAIQRCLEAGAVECMFKNEAKELFMARVGSLARQIEMQRRVLEERARLDGILGSVGDGVYGVDSQGRITFINAMALRLVGRTDESPCAARAPSSCCTIPPRTARATSPARPRWAAPTRRANRSAPSRPCSGRDDGERSRSSARCCRWRSAAGAKARWWCSAISPSARVPIACAGNSPTTRSPGLCNRATSTGAGRRSRRRREHGGYAALLYFDIDRFTL